MVFKTNCYSRVTLVDPWFAGKILMKNGKLLALFHGVAKIVDIQKNQECLSMYHITENGLMIVLKNVGLPKTLAISLKIRWTKSWVLCIGFFGRLLVFGPSRHLMGILGMDFDRILRMHYFLVTLASSLCLMVLISICKTKIGTV